MTSTEKHHNPHASSTTTHQQQQRNHHNNHARQQRLEASFLSGINPGATQNTATTNPSYPSATTNTTLHVNNMSAATAASILAASIPAGRKPSNGIFTNEGSSSASQAGAPPPPNGGGGGSSSSAADGTSHPTSLNTEGGENAAGDADGGGGDAGDGSSEANIDPPEPPSFTPPPSPAMVVATPTSIRRAKEAVYQRHEHCLLNMSPESIRRSAPRPEPIATPPPPPPPPPSDAGGFLMSTVTSVSLMNGSPSSPVPEGATPSAAFPHVASNGSFVDNTSSRLASSFIERQQQGAATNNNNNMAAVTNTAAGLLIQDSGTMSLRIGSGTLPHLFDPGLGSGSFEAVSSPTTLMPPAPTNETLRPNNHSLSSPTQSLGPSYSPPQQQQLSDTNNNDEDSTAAGGGLEGVGPEGANSFIMMASQVPPSAVEWLLSHKQFAPLPSTSRNNNNNYSKFGSSIFTASMMDWGGLAASSSTGHQHQRSLHNLMAAHNKHPRTSMGGGQMSMSAIFNNMNNNRSQSANYNANQLERSPSGMVHASSWMDFGTPHIIDPDSDDFLNNNRTPTSMSPVGGMGTHVPSFPSPTDSQSPTNLAIQHREKYALSLAAEYKDHFDTTLSVATDKAFPIPVNGHTRQQLLTIWGQQQQEYQQLVAAAELAASTAAAGATTTPGASSSSVIAAPRPTAVANFDLNTNEALDVDEGQIKSISYYAATPFGSSENIVQATFARQRRKLYAAMNKPLVNNNNNNTDSRSSKNQQKSPSAVNLHSSGFPRFPFHPLNIDTTTPPVTAEDGAPSTTTTDQSSIITPGNTTTTTTTTIKGNTTNSGEGGGKKRESDPTHSDPSSGKSTLKNRTNKDPKEKTSTSRTTNKAASRDHKEHKSSRNKSPQQQRRGGGAQPTNKKQPQRHGGTKENSHSKKNLNKSTTMGDHSNSTNGGGMVNQQSMESGNGGVGSGSGDTATTSMGQLNTTQQQVSKKARCFYNPPPLAICSVITMFGENARRVAAEAAQDEDIIISSCSASTDEDLDDDLDRDPEGAIDDLEDDDEEGRAKRTEMAARRARIERKQRRKLLRGTGGPNRQNNENERKRGIIYNMGVSLLGAVGLRPDGGDSSLIDGERQQDYMAALTGEGSVIIPSHSSAYKAVGDLSPSSLQAPEYNELTSDVAPASGGVAPAFLSESQLLRAAAFREDTLTSSLTRYDTQFTSNPQLLAALAGASVARGALPYDGDGVTLENVLVVSGRGGVQAAPADPNNQRPNRQRNFYYDVQLAEKLRRDLPVNRDAYYLDNPDEASDRRRKIVTMGPSMVPYKCSIVPFIDEIVKKEDVNNQFFIHHPELEARGIKLTHIRKLKSVLFRQLCWDSDSSYIDVSTVAYAVWYLERLVLKGYVTKANRKAVAAVCMVLAVKYWETGLANANKKEGLNSKIAFTYKKLESCFGVPIKKMRRSELSVYAALDFALVAPDPSIVKQHIERLLEEVYVTMGEYFQTTFEELDSAMAKGVCVYDDDGENSHRHYSDEDEDEDDDIDGSSSSTKSRDENNS